MLDGHLVITKIKDMVSAVHGFMTDQNLNA